MRDVDHGTTGWVDYTERRLRRIEREQRRLDWLMAITLVLAVIALVLTLT